MYPSQLLKHRTVKGKDVLKTKRQAQVVQQNRFKVTEETENYRKE